MSLLKIFALVMIVSTMLGAGLQVDRERLVATLRQYGLMSRALLANFVLVPLFAVLVVRFFRIEGDVATGIVLMSMAPGVPFLANSAGRKAGGSLSFALAIAFCFAALSVVTIPITIWLISLAIPSAPVPPVPVAKFLTTLVAFQLVPLLLGALIGPRLPTPMADKTVKLLNLVFLAAALVFVVIMFPRILTALTSVYGYGQLLIIALVGAFSILAGWLLGGPDRRYRRTLSIATLLRNVGLCALIGSEKVFEGTLVLPTIIAYLIVTVILSLPLRVYYGRTKDSPAVASS